MKATITKYAIRNTRNPDFFFESILGRKVRYEALEDAKLFALKEFAEVRAYSLTELNCEVEVVEVKITMEVQM